MEAATSPSRWDDGGFKVGQNYQGGIIVYVDGTGRHGFIAATSDQSSKIQWINGTSYAGPISTGELGTSIGTGKSNTEKIVQAQGNGTYAARLCYNLTFGGYNDWYLPSKDEIYELYRNRDAIGLNLQVYYWTSSVYLNSVNWWFAYVLISNNGSINNGIMINRDDARVRCIRNF